MANTSRLSGRWFLSACCLCKPGSLPHHHHNQRAVYMVCRASGTLSGLNGFFWKEQDGKKRKKAMAKIYDGARISAPSMRKMHFSSFLVHWLGPGGQTLRVWCRAPLSPLSLFLCRLRLFLMRSNPEGCADAWHGAKRKVKNDVLILFVFFAGRYIFYT